MNKTRYEITSASDKSIGFDYQFYYYMYLILDLRHNEKIAIEIKDDIHIEFTDGKLILIQTKHTTQTNQDSTSINLTERDSDLWKTLSNWVKVINEATDKKTFLKTTSFQLISNKSLSSNPFFIELQKLLNTDITVKEFKNYLQVLIDKGTDITINGYIKSLKSLNNELLYSFIKKLEFKLNEDNIIDKIKERILEKIYFKERVDDVFNDLYSELKTKEYLDVKKGNKKELSFEDFVSNFRKCFKKGLNDKLPIRKFDINTPSEIENQKFILQLIDIGDIGSNDTDEMLEYTIQMFQLFNNLKKWEEDGDLLNHEIEEFHKQSILIWKNSFREKFRQIKTKVESNISVDDSEIKHKALECLDEMRKAILQIDETLLSVELSNGHFYNLTNNDQIGWHYDWKTRY
ncbi:ABC-three component system protein [Flavobacterium acetivorans]|uniref:ABC-three component system protein n=1 Tax=Flavobacterium acetivorans TaxID=2893883 RepID=UPI001E603DC3|nr:ABC-three component system protein [Flavobacterium sp. F-29]UFH36065.1 DUF4297 domain-containing protein [Flavobacterium sp. F-29]